MKYPFNIAKFLRRFFSVVRTIIVLGAGVVILGELDLIPSKRDKPVHIPVMFPELRINLTQGMTGIQTDESEAGDIVIPKLAGRFTLNRHSKDSQLVARSRWIMIPTIVFTFVCGFYGCTLLRKLCKNIEEGTVFSDTNFRLLRNIGLLIVIGDLVGNLIVILSRYVIGSYLTQHARLTGIEGSLSIEVRSDLSFSGIIVGLFVLLLAEAFRQGLTLKQESELTV